MNRLIRPLLVACALAAGAAGALAADPAASRITERQVRDLVDKATRAANARDVPAIMATVAPDARIVLDFRGPGGKRQRMRMNREQYEAKARESLGQIGKYSYKREKVDVAIAPDGQTATVKSRVREVAEYQGNTVVAAIDETATLALRDGRLLVTEVQGFVR